ncbi:hypothetical protein DL96DRAFT_1625190 [Flagelloscypha sp. PMI_526]|nr:hypothetical protein DL96DRAFT_1625190 [Flagelloscypha sp. PMI_526]
MRVAYLYRLWDTHTTSVTRSDRMLENLARLYTNQALQVLELKMVYPRQLLHSGGPSLARSFLPKSHIFPQLRCFWIVTERVGTSNLHETNHITWFIRAHARTLRSIKVHKFQAVIEDLFTNTVVFPLQPSFSIAFNSAQSLQTVTTTPLKIALVEACMPFGYILPSHHSFQKLLRLHIHVNELHLASFDQWANQLPQLLSLSVRYHRLSDIYNDVSCRIANTPNLTLSRCGLRDLALFSAFGSVPIPPNYHLMRNVARLMPNIESFAGRGDMSELYEGWEAEYPWSRNVYIDAIMDGTAK